MGIRLHSVFKHYQNGDEVTEVLKDISLEVRDGDFLAIIGPSGSGKSTLMNIIGCLDQPSRGIYELDGQDISNLGDNRLAEIRNQHIGFIFQSFNLLPQYSALENVELALQYGRTPPKESQAKAREALVALGLEDRLKHKPNQLSGGQKQRVAIARALVNSPTILLADEPTGNLDSKTGAEVLEIFQELNQQGKTIIIVTHDLEIAQQAARIVRIRDGVIEEVAH